MKKIVAYAVAEFLKKGGKVTVYASRHAHGAQKKQSNKVPSRFRGLVK